MKKITGFSLMFLAMASFAVAGVLGTPEIDAGSAAGAVALLSGGLLVLRARRRTR